MSDAATQWERISERADHAAHDVAQCHLSEFRGTADLYPDR
jgi:hypothetical protein